MKLEPAGSIIFRGFCSLCEVDNRRGGGMLGFVEVDNADGGTVWGWVYHDPRGVAIGERGPLPTRRTDGYRLLRHPAKPAMDLPEFLDGYCRRGHGAGRVSAAEVIEKTLRAAAGGAQRDVLTFVA